MNDAMTLRLRQTIHQLEQSKLELMALIHDLPRSDVMAQALLVHDETCQTIARFRAELLELERPVRPFGSVAVAA